MKRIVSSGASSGACSPAEGGGGYLLALRAHPAPTVLCSLAAPESNPSFKLSDSFTFCLRMNSCVTLSSYGSFGFVEKMHL